MTKDEIDASGAPHSCIRSTSPPSKEVALADELAAINVLRLELGHITDGDGAPIDDEAVIFFVGDEDMASEIKVSTPNALHVATRLVELWNAAALQSVQPPGEGVESALRDIISWKEDTLGVRPRAQGLYDCPPEITEAFDRGARMAFYRCAIRASAALPPVSGDDRK